MKEFECELDNPDIPNKKLIPGYEVLKNSELPATALTLKNHFKKLNFTHFTPNTIKIRRS